MAVPFRTACTVVALWATASSNTAIAGGSNYMVQPGANPATTNEGIRKMIVDARGRLWYTGSHSGKRGAIE